MYNLDYFFRNNLVALKIPWGWTIIKNNLVTIDTETLALLDEDTLFLLKNLCFYHEIFSSEFHHSVPKTYGCYVRVFYCSDEISNNGTYELSCYIHKNSKNKNNQDELFLKEKNYDSLAELVKALDFLHINISEKIEDIEQKKRFSTIADFFLE